MSSYKRMTEEDWLSSNMSRNYPLSDDANPTIGGGYGLPDSFLADIGIYALPGTDTNVPTKFYVDSVYRTEDSTLAIDFGYNTGEEQGLVFARATGIPATLVSGDSVESRTFSIVPDISNIPDEYEALRFAAGTVVIGTCKDIVNPLYALGPDRGKILPTCVITTTSGITGILVGTSLLTGTVSLQAGDGIELSTDADNNIYINRVKTEEERLSRFQSVDDVIEAVEEKFGNAIKTINGIGPDSEGNFQLVGDDCTRIEASENGVSISNPCAKPCCPDAESPDVSEALSSLEEAKNRLEGYYSELSGRIGEMQARLASLISSK